MADDASGDEHDDRDDRDGGNVQSEETPDVTAGNWRTDHDARSDGAATPEDIEDAMADGPNGRDTGGGTDHAGNGDERADRGRIPIDLSGSDADRESDGGTGDAAEDGHVPEPSSARIEPGDPDLEHAIFVLLGVIAMVLVIIRLLALPLG